MKLSTFLYELVEVLGALTDIDDVKLIPTPDGCKIECMVKNILVLHASATEVVEDLTDVVGIPSIKGLKGTLAAPGLARTTAVATFTQNLRVPRITLTDGKGNSYDLALYRKELADDLIKVPKLKNVPVYEVATHPSETGIALFKHWAREMNEYKNANRFIPFTTLANQLVFRYRLGLLENNDFVFAENSGSSLDPDWSYADKPLLQLLKLYSTSQSFTVRISNQGLLTVELKTTLATYLFHFLPSKV